MTVEPGTTFLFKMSPRVSAHLARAVRTYRDEARRRYEQVPAELADIEHMLSARAMGGQEGSPVDQPARAADAAPMADLLTYRQAATVCGYSERTLKRRVAGGGLPVVRDGRVVRIRRTALDAYLTERSTTC